MIQKTVLVIDDDEGILEAFEVMLESAGYTVLSSSDAELIHSLTPKQLPDVILLDVLLSGVDGRDICRKLKSDPLTKNIPIIMVSAHPSAYKTIKQAGADDFLSKPFEMDELLAKVAARIS